MANVFLNREPRDIETAIMLEQAYIHDIGNGAAYTDGDKIFVNTDDNLFKIFPDYNHDFLKWLLWHERYHIELRHHKRYFKYLKELEESKEDMLVTKDEVNIIMDILVHDSLSKLFPELIPTAETNLAQFRNRNSLGYTFETFTLEEMLNEYKEHKDPESESKSKGSEGEEDSKEEDKSEEESETKGHGESDKGEETETKGKKTKEDEDPEINPDAPAPEPEHDKTDWSKLKDIDTEEFITKEESDDYMDEINRLKRKKFRMAKLTETLNGLATSTRKRTYAMPSSIKLSGGAVLKGSTPGRAMLHLCFDASGSMGSELATFKEIISKSIPQAMDTPTTWFSGYNEKIKADPDGRSYDYYKGKFKDIMPVCASSGYGDDGDRTIELCWKAEQAGYSPIGVTDGGGQISWSRDMIKQLKRTVLVGQSETWLKKVQEINPKIQIIHI